MGFFSKDGLDISNKKCPYEGKETEAVTRAEKILRKKTVYKNELDRIMPAEKSNALWKKTEEKLESVLTRYEDLPGGVQFHTDRIFPAAAFYLTVRETVGQERAFHILEDAAVRGCEGIGKRLRKIMKIPGMPGLFVAVWDPMTKKVFGSGNGFQNRFYPGKKGEYRMDILSCPYHRFFTELGCPELTRIFCENDERLYGNLPGLQFKRTGTLGKGAACCDFYIRETKRTRNK